MTGTGGSHIVPSVISGPNDKQVWTSNENNSIPLVHNSGRESVCETFHQVLSVKQKVHVASSY